MKVEFFSCRIEEVWGLDLAINHPEATVFDLIEAVQPWCDDEQIHKQYMEENQGACKGCAANCCRESFVLPDSISFQWLSEYLDLEPADFIRQYFDPELLAKGLPRLQGSPCVFLREGLCSVYPYRTLICRLYICTPMSDEAQTLVYGVVAAGIGEFLRLAQTEGYLDLATDIPIAWSGYEKMMMELIQSEAQRSDNPFRGAHKYQEIPLRSFSNQSDWKLLTGKRKRKRC
jgi:Fe-S-cluster containining protein